MLSKREKKRKFYEKLVKLSKEIEEHPENLVPLEET
jgi:hypothetical protein